MIRSSCGNPVSVTIHQLLLLFPGSLQATQTLYRSRLIVRRGVGRFEPPVRTWLSQKKSRNCRFEPPVHPRTGSGCCRFAGSAVRRFTGLAVHRLAGSQVPRLTGSPVGRFSGSMVRRAGSAGSSLRFEPGPREKCPSLPVRTRVRRFGHRFAGSP